MTIRLACVAIAVAVAALPGEATAQGRNDVAKDIAELREQVTELRQAAATTATVADALQGIDERLAVLEQEVQRLDREQKSIPEARAALDELNRKVDEISQDLQGVRTAVGDLERPPVASAPSGAYSVAIDGYAQVRWQGTLNEDFDFDESTLRLRRGRVGLRGHLGTDRLTYRVLAELTSTRPARDFYVDYEIVPEAVIRAGQYKVPYTLSFLTSSTRLAFPDRPAVVDAYGYGRDVQVGVRGKAIDDRLTYYAGIGNGSGPNAVNDNIDYMFAGRVDVGVMGPVATYSMGDVEGGDDLRITAGGSAIYDLTAMPNQIPGVVNVLGEPVSLNVDVDQDGDRDNVAVFSASLDAQLKWRGLSATAEWLVRNEDWGTIEQANPELRDALDALGGDGETRWYQGFYGQLTYMVMPRRLMVGARGSHARLPLLGLGETADGAPRAGRLFQASGLVQLYDDAFGGRALGLQYTYSDFNGTNDPDPELDKFHTFLLETQFKF